jgi:hypothetical protein
VIVAVPASSDAARFNAFDNCEAKDCTYISEAPYRNDIAGRSLLDQHCQALLLQQVGHAEALHSHVAGRWV